MLQRPSSVQTAIPDWLKRGMEIAADKKADVEEEGTELLTEQASTTFRNYDIEANGTLGHSQMVAAMAEMGAMHGVTPKVLEEVLARDPFTSRDARYTLHDFLNMYARLSQHRAKAGRDERILNLSRNSEPPIGAEHDPALRQVFGAYCRFTAGVSKLLISEKAPAMVSQQLHKLCTDMNAYGDQGHHISTSSVDIAFTRCKAPGGRRLSFPQFLRVLCMLSDDSGLDLFHMMVTHAPKLGTRGLPAPVDPVTMRLLNNTFGNDALPAIPGSREGARQPHTAPSGAEGPASWANGTPVAGAGRANRNGIGHISPARHIRSVGGNIGSGYGGGGLGAPVRSGVFAPGGLSAVPSAWEVDQGVQPMRSSPSHARPAKTSPGRNTMRTSPGRNTTSRAGDRQATAAFKAAQGAPAGSNGGGWPTAHLAAFSDFPLAAAGSAAIAAAERSALHPELYAEQSGSVPVARALLFNNYVSSSKDDDPVATRAAYRATVGLAVAEASAALAAARARADASDDDEFTGDVGHRQWMVLDRQWLTQAQAWAGFSLDPDISPSEPALPRTSRTAAEILSRICNLESHTGWAEQAGAAADASRDAGAGERGSKLRSAAPATLAERMAAAEAALLLLQQATHKLPPHATPLGGLLTTMDDGVASAHEALQASSVETHDRLQALQLQLDEAASAQRVAEAEQLSAAEDVAAVAQRAAEWAEEQNEALMKRLDALERTSASSVASSVSGVAKAAAGTIEGGGTDVAVLSQLQALEKKMAAMMVENVTLQRRLKVVEMKRGVLGVGDPSAVAAMQERLEGMEGAATAAAVAMEERLDDLDGAAIAAAAENVTLQRRLKVVEAKRGVAGGGGDSSVVQALRERMEGMEGAASAAAAAMQERLDDMDGASSAAAAALQERLEDMDGAVTAAAVYNAAQLEELTEQIEAAESLAEALATAAEPAAAAMEVRVSACEKLAAGSKNRQAPETTAPMEAEGVKRGAADGTTGWEAAFEAVIELALDELRARVGELEVESSTESLLHELRARVEEVEARPCAPEPPANAAESATESSLDGMRARLDELEARPSALAPSVGVAESAIKTALDELRARLRQLEARPQALAPLADTAGVERRLAACEARVEVQAAEAPELRVRVGELEARPRASAMPASATELSSSLELRARVGELEARLHTPALPAPAVDAAGVEYRIAACEARAEAQSAEVMELHAQMAVLRAEAAAASMQLQPVQEERTSTAQAPESDGRGSGATAAAMQLSQVMLDTLQARVVELEGRCSLLDDGLALASKASVSDRQASQASELAVAGLSGKLLKEQQRGVDMSASFQGLRNQVDEQWALTMSWLGDASMGVVGTTSAGGGLEDRLQQLAALLRLEIQQAHEEGVSVSAAAMEGGSGLTSGADLAEMMGRITELERQARSASQQLAGMTQPEPVSGQLRDKLEQPSAAMAATEGMAALSGRMAELEGQVKGQLQDMHAQLQIEIQRGIEEVASASGLRTGNPSPSRRQSYAITTAAALGKGESSAFAVQTSSPSGTAAGGHRRSSQEPPMPSVASMPLPSVSKELITSLMERLTDLEGRVDFTASRVAAIGPLEVHVSSHDGRLAAALESAVAAGDAASRATDSTTAMEASIKELQESIVKLRGLSPASGSGTSETAAAAAGAGETMSPSELRSRLVAAEASAAEVQRLAPAVEQLERKVSELGLKADGADNRAAAAAKLLAELSADLERLAKDVAVAQAVKQFSTIENPAAASVGGGGGGSEDDIHQMARAMGELAGRLVAIERDVSLTLSSYARVVDLKESENHLLDRQAQLHHEVLSVRDSVKVLRDDVLISSSGFSAAASMSGKWKDATPSTPVLSPQRSVKVSMTAGGKSLSTNPNKGAADMMQMLAGYATVDMIRHSDLVASQKTSTLRSDLDSLTETLLGRLDAHEQIIMKMAHQIDVLQDEVRAEQMAGGLGMGDVEAMLADRQLVTRASFEELQGLVSRMDEGQEVLNGLVASLQSRVLELQPGLQSLQTWAGELQPDLQSLQAWAGEVGPQLALVHAQLSETEGALGSAIVAGDGKINKRVDLQEKVIMRIAQQVDVLQKAAGGKE